MWDLYLLLKKKLETFSVYKESRDVATTYDTKLVISHIGKTIVPPPTCVDLMLL